MNNINYLPFERNRYYYGKLLSVEDFELEQRYQNNKRRLSNRFLGGSGVVCGLDVTVIDDETISLERGIAVDSIGREIIVEEAVTKKLSDIEGYDRIQTESIPYAYLCIEYAEEEREAVHNIAGKNQDRDQEFNKYKEGNRLYLSNLEPRVLNALSGEGIYAERILAYDGNGIKIYHIIPRYVRQDEAFDFVVEIENTGQAEDFAFSYEISLIFLKYQDKPKISVDFDERLVKKETRYQLTYKLSSVHAEGEASAEIDSGSFRFSAGGQILTPEISGISKTTVVFGNLVSQIMDSYYHFGMDRAMERQNGYAVYLSKLFLVKAGSSSVVKQIEAVPFGQYVYGNDLNYAVVRQLLSEIKQLKEKMEAMEEISSKGTYRQDGHAPVQENNIAFGVYELEIAGNKKRNQIYESEEIVHGLGIGQVMVVLGIENEDGEIRYGMDIEKEFDLAAKVDLKKGTFVLSAKYRIGHDKENIRIYWTAIKNPAAAETGRQEKMLTVYPGVMEMKVMESRFLDVSCINMKDKRLSFYVKENEGIIDRNGLYTAPDREGIFEVKIESMAYAGVGTTVYIVVREEKKEA